MINSNLALKNDEKIWNLPEWYYLVKETARVFRLTEKEINRLENSNTAKIIATIPFEANCKDPERTAIAHLCLYVAEIQGYQKFCSHQISDDTDIFNRLSFISTFEGGNQTIIEHGMNILALIMLEGYKKSELKDKQNNVYNPLVSGVWDYRQIKNKLIWEINKIKVPDLDWIFTFNPLDIW